MAPGRVSGQGGREAGMEGEGGGRGRREGEEIRGRRFGGKHLPRLKSPGKSVCGLR